MHVRFALFVLILASAPLAAQTAPPATADARLAMARDVAARVLPPGAMQTMMGAVMDAVPGQVMGQMMNQRLAEYAGMAGADAEQLQQQLGQATIGQLMAILDPVFEERQRRTMAAMSKGMIAVFTQMEPEMREGMAEAYASRLTPEELAAAHAFYTTPLGSAVAAKNMQLASDPAYMKRAQTMQALLMQRMPAIMADAQKAAADLPPPRKPQDLTAAERDRLLALIKPKK
jgi:hypothetical protein